MKVNTVLRHCLLLAVLCGFPSLVGAVNDHDLPPQIDQWLTQATSELEEIFVEQFPGDERVNRQKVAANAAIQEYLHRSGEQLASMPEFSPELRGRFMRKRVKSQPVGSVGQKPSETSAEIMTAAFHTAAGLGEIICSNQNWKNALAMHFYRVGEHDQKAK